MTICGTCYKPCGPNPELCINAAECREAENRRREGEGLGGLDGPMTFFHEEIQRGGVESTDYERAYYRELAHERRVNMYEDELKCMDFKIFIAYAIAAACFAGMMILLLMRNK